MKFLKRKKSRKLRKIPVSLTKNCGECKRVLFYKMSFDFFQKILKNTKTILRGLSFISISYNISNNSTNSTKFSYKGGVPPPPPFP